MPTGYPKIDPPAKLPDGTYIVRVHRAPGEIEEVPADDLKKARELVKYLERAAALLTPREFEAPPKIGRPVKLTPQLQAKFYEAVSVGGSWQVSCDSCGITYQTFKNWRHRAEEGEEPFATFFAGLKKHRADGTLHHWRRIHRGESSWQASARWLEARDPRFIRRMPEQLAPSVTVTFSRPLPTDGASDALQEVTVDEPASSGDSGPGSNGDGSKNQ